ncbi:MAG: hypoxanthine phosphoribosyltransferase [Defluviitaleaceae bacterium]|nr:hypoxanthine phosphoribosyltransferase [Defluviitaleaceae bacterium]
MKKESIEVLFTADEISRNLDTLARQIENDYLGQELVMVSVLTGSMMFVSDLARKIDNNKVDVRIDIISASSYGLGTESGDRVNINLDTREHLKGRNVMVVEDIVDTGKTLNFITYLLKYHQPSSVKICALLNKPSRRDPALKDLKIDYLAFPSIEDYFVVGYGLDCAQKYRNLPYVGILSFEE